MVLGVLFSIAIMLWIVSWVARRFFGRELGLIPEPVRVRRHIRHNRRGD